MGSVIPRHPCLLAGAAVTKHHREDGSNSRNVSPCGTCESEVKLWAGLVPSESREDVPGLSPGFVASRLFPVSLSPSLWVWLSAFTFPGLVKTPVIPI